MLPSCCFSSPRVFPQHDTRSYEVSLQQGCWMRVPAAVPAAPLPSVGRHHPLDPPRLWLYLYNNITLILSPFPVLAVSCSFFTCWADFAATEEGTRCGSKLVRAERLLSFSNRSMLFSPAVPLRHFPLSASLQGMQLGQRLAEISLGTDSAEVFKEMFTCRG